MDSFATPRKQCGGAVAAPTNPIDMPLGATVRDLLLPRE